MANTKVTEDRVRTSIRMKRQLIRDAKKAAIDSGRTLTQFIEDSVQQSLEREATGKREPVKLHTFGEGGLLPGIDINNSAQLWDILDGIEDDTPRR